MTDLEASDIKVTDTIKIRHAEDEDLEPLTQIYNHYVRHSIATFDTTSFTPEARRNWLLHHAVGTPHQLWVAEQNSAILGYVSSSQFRPKAAYDRSVETSVYLHPDHLRKGLGQTLYKHLFERLTPFDLHRAFAGIAHPNPASVALHKAIGFTKVGSFSDAGYKFGGYHTVHWYEKDLSQLV